MPEPISPDLLKASMAFHARNNDEAISTLAQVAQGHESIRAQLPGIGSRPGAFLRNDMSNKDLWNRVFTTDPRAVKPITGKPYKGNSPKPYWLIERATEEFGPVGIGWGVNVKSEQYIHIGEHDVLHSCIVQVWYVLDGVTSSTFEQAGGTKAAYMSKNGLIVDEDAAKKSVTDATVKCLSMIGFAGDIFSGMWDDSKYVDHAAQVYADRERAEWLENQAHRLEACENLAELGLAWTDMFKVMRSNNDQDAIDTLTPVKDRMKQTIEENTK